MSQVVQFIETFLIFHHKHYHDIQACLHNVRFSKYISLDKDVHISK